MRKRSFRHKQAHVPLRSHGIYALVYTPKTKTFRATAQQTTSHQPTERWRSWLCGALWRRVMRDDDIHICIVHADDDDDIGCCVHLPGMIRKPTPTPTPTRSTRGPPNDRRHNKQQRERTAAERKLTRRLKRECVASALAARRESQPNPDRTNATDYYTSRPTRRLAC